MATLDVFVKTQPQLSQLEPKFKAPPIKDMAVETFNDLLGFDIKFNYKHKIVWVRDQACNYYLENGDGSNAINWKRAITRAIINPYNQEDTYQAGESVFISNRIYSAIQAVPKYYSPLDYPAYWKVISGETVTYRYLFFNASSVIIYTEIRNPIFEVVLGTIALDGNGNPLIDATTGLVVIDNYEIVDAPVYERKDLPPNNGVAYEVRFYTNSELTNQISGCINVK